MRTTSLANLLACCLAFGAILSSGCLRTHEKGSVRVAEGMAIQAAYFRSEKHSAAQWDPQPNAVWQALKQRERIESADAAGVYPGGWTWLGPGNIGGRVRSIVIHPTNPNIMWTGGLSGGIWKTVNGGAAWAPMDDFMSVLPIGCMAIDKLNPNVLYAGTGEGFFETVEGSSNTAAVRGAGVFKSIDGGATWSQLPSTLGANWHFVNRIEVSPGNSSLVLAATQSGIWRSTDAGGSWSQVSTGIAYDIRFHPTDFTKLIAGFHDLGVKYSNDGGVTWLTSTGLGTQHRTEVRFAPSSPSTVYCAAASSSRIKIFRSTNGGATFSLMTTGSGISNYEAYNVVLWVDPVNAANLIVGGIYLFRSSNSGATFAQGFNNVHADMHEIVSDPGFNGTTNRRIFFGTDGGIYRANDHTSNTVTALNNNLGITQFYGAVLNPANGQIVGGTQDNGTIRATTNPQSWNSIFGGDGVYCEYDPTDPNYWYGGIYYAQIFRSTTGGPNGAYVYNGIADAGNAATCNFIAFFALDPNSANRMLVGARSLWRSDNIKAATPTWTAIKPTIQPGGRSGGNGVKEAHFAQNPPWNISTFSVSQGNSDLIWVGYNNGEVWKTTNGTAATPTWTRVDNGANQLPARWVGSIRIDPLDSNRVYVSFMGYESDNLWRTTNGGSSWTEISGDLPSAPISAVTTHPTNANWIYVGTDVGLFTSSDSGSNWTTTNQGPSIVPIEELRWVTPTRLLAVTHGRGAYAADIPNPDDEPCSPTSFAVIVGTRISGRINEVLASDDARLDVQGEFVSSDFVYPVAVRFDFQSPHAAISSLSIRLEAQANEQNLGQKISLWNWQANDWEVIDTRLSSLADSTAIGSASGNLSRFVQPGTRLVRAFATFEPSASESSNVWNAKIDQIVMTVRD